MKQKIVLGFCSIILFLSFLSFLPVEATTPPREGISFQPNVIPFLNITDRPVDKPESFRFEWLGNRMDIEIFFNATLLQKGVNVTKLWSLRDFEDDFGVVVDYQVHKNESSVQFGWVVDDVENVSSFVHNAWFKIEDTKPFDYDEIELEEIEVLEFEQEPYNITRFHLPDNLVLSFEDLYHKGFVIGHQNKTSTSVKGFSGKSSWNLDPITFSGGIITVIGGTEGSPLTFDDIWQADQTGGWAVVNKTVNQYAFDCRIVLGNGTVAGTTWLIDTNKQILIKSTAMTTGQYWMELTRYSYLRLGSLVDATDKTTKDGCQIINMLGSDEVIIYASHGYNTEVSLYGCNIVDGGTGKSWVYAKGVFNIYESQLVTARCDTLYTVGDFYRVTFRDGVSGFYTPKGTMDEIYIHDTSSYAMRAIFGFPINVENFKARDVTYVVQSYSTSVDSYIINGDVDTWSFQWQLTCTGEVYRQYTFDLTITYPDGTAVENANVTISYEGQGGGTVGTWLTDENGEITSQTLTMGFYNQTGGDTIYSYNPIVIEVANTIPGYLGYTQKLTLSQETDLTIALQDDDTYVWWTLSLCWIPVAIALIIVAQKRRLRADRTRNNP